jgi:hypothetical protein
MILGSFKMKVKDVGILKIIAISERKIISCTEIMIKVLGLKLI